MLTLYRCFMGLVAAALWLPGRLLLWRGQSAWADRLQWRKLEPATVWLHGASVGEVRLLSYLARHLLEARPDLALHVSAMTPTGHATAAQLIPGARLSYFPLDVPRLMRRRLTQLSPAVIVCVEVEIWPALLAEAARRGVPVILANARLKERSHRRYGRFPVATRRLLSRYNRFFYRSQEDRQRYESLGAPPAKGEVAGDMKFDAPVLARSASDRLALRRLLGCSESDVLLVMGSTRPDEEDKVSAELLALMQRRGELRVVLAPRHVERASEVEAILRRAGFAPSLLFSDLSKANVGADEAGAAGRAQSETDVPRVVIVDQLGKLNDLYHASDLAFVGGTLTNTGGHNILEPVWCGRPVLFGPDTRSIVEAADYVLTHGYGRQVADARGLMESVEQWMDGRLRFEVRGESAERDSAIARAAAYILSLL